MRQRWREAGGPGSGLWFDLGPHILDQSLQLFGQPDWLQADLAQQRPGALADDYFHVVLGYGEMRVVLHGSCLVSATMPRFVIHGSEGSFIKFGMDVQEDQLKLGKRPPAADWEWTMNPASSAGSAMVSCSSRAWLARRGLRRLLSRCLRRHSWGRRQPGTGRRGTGGDGAADLARDSAREGKRLACQILSD